jgi:tetratricopeptide (TPR) repeat protein
MGHIETAAGYYAESLTVSRQLAETNFVASALQGLGSTYIAQQQYDQAAAHLRESLIIFTDLKDRRGPFNTLDAFMRLAAAENRHIRAATLLGAVEAIRETLGIPPRPVDDSVVAGLRLSLDEASFTAALGQGRALTYDEIITFALGD